MSTHTTVALRCLKVELPAKRKAPVTIVHVREENPSAERLEWFLLTTLPVENADDAKRPGTACAGELKIIFAS